MTAREDRQRALAEQNIRSPTAPLVQRDLEDQDYVSIRQQFASGTMQQPWLSGDVDAAVDAVENAYETTYKAALLAAINGSFTEAEQELILCLWLANKAERGG